MFDPKNRPYSPRVQDEFLRRISGGNFSMPTGAFPDEIPFSRAEQSVPEENPSLSREENSSPRTDNFTPRAENSADENGCVRMPSLAMVYAPVQNWEDVLTPMQGLCEGTIFGKLIKPFCGKSIVGR